MILDTLRHEIETCGKTRYLISKESCVSEGQLTRLMQGRGFRCETADQLLEYFGYQLVKVKREKR